MRLVAKVLWVLALWMFAIGGCNEVTTPTTAELRVSLVSFEPQQPGAQVPVEGARICEIDTDNCVFTDANGHATLWLPIGETAYTRDGEGLAPWLQPIIMPEEGLPAESAEEVPTVQRIAAEHSRVGSPYPMRGTGTVGVILFPKFTGVTAELDAATGVPFYVDEEWNWDPDLSATTVRGRVGFTEVTPGEVQVNLGGSVDNCITGGYGWPSKVNSVRLPVREGYVTVVNVQCPLPFLASQPHGR